MKLTRSANPLFISGISQVFIVTILLANSLQASQSHTPENLQIIASVPSESTAATKYQLPEALQAQLPKKAKETSITQGPIRATIQILHEGFEEVFPTGLWVIDPPGPSGCFWNRTEVAADVGSWSGSPVVIACGGVPGLTYPNNMNSITTYGPFDLSDATSAEMRFRLAHELGAGDDLFWYGSSGDGSGYSLASMGGGDFSWQSVTRSLDNHLGDSSVWIMLRMTSDGTSNKARGVLVDEIFIEKSDDPPAPELEMISIDVPDGAYQQGDPLTASTVMGNSGNLISTSSSVDYYASDNTIISQYDTFLGDCVDLPPIPAGDGIGFDCPLSIPTDLPNGDYYIGGIIDFADSDPDNNIGYDPSAITVYSKPDILVRPLSLDITEQVSRGPDGAAVDGTAPISSRAHTESIMPDLLRAADERGYAHIIVGLQTGFQAEALLDGAAKSAQRRDILDTGNRLVAELRGFGTEIMHQYQTIPFLAMRADRDSLEYLLQSPLVKNIEDDNPEKPHLDSSNQVIGTPAAWAEGYDGSGWTVAVLDSGTDKTHSWYSTGGNKVVSEACYSTTTPGISESLCPGGVASSTAENSALPCEPSLDGCDHGTHVAGIVAGNDGSGPNYGVARGADLIAMQVFSKFLLEANCGVDEPVPCTLSRPSDQIAALERVLFLSAGMNIAAVNMSLGGGQYFDQASCDLDNPGRNAAIFNLRAAGIATVISSGNKGYRDAIGAPGCLSNAISVGATDDIDNVASFSNIYPQLHVLAPGVAIDSSIPGNSVESNQGTSMSAPHVAGAWAVIKQRMPTASVSDVLNAFTTTGTQVADERPAPRSSTEESSSPGETRGPVQTFPRINVDMALGEPRSTFAIINEGGSVLDAISVTPETAAPWISLVPSPPYSLTLGELQVVSVVIDFDLAPEGTSKVRLLVISDDPDESPYPFGVYVNVTKGPLVGDIHDDGFESDP